MTPCPVSVQTIQTVYVTGMVVTQADQVDVTFHTTGSDGLACLAGQIGALQGQLAALCAQVDALCGVPSDDGRVRGEPVPADR